jgi:hypothetical protein
MQLKNFENKVSFKSLCVNFLISFIPCLFVFLCSFVCSSKISRPTSRGLCLLKFCFIASLFLLLSSPNNAHANRLFTSGFELQSVTAGIEFSNKAGNPAIDTTIKHSGNASMKSMASGDFLSHQVTSATGSELWSRVYIYPASNTTSVFAISDGNLDGVWLVMNTNGTLELWNADNDVLTTQIGSASAALSLNTWYRLEVYLESVGTTWKASARVNGVTFTSTSSIAAAGSSSGMTIWPGVYGSAATVYYDDIAVNDVFGSFQYSWPGNGGVVVLVPNAAGDSNCTTGDFSMVAEIPPSNTATSGSTMCELDTNTTTAYFNVTNSATAGIGSSDYISLVSILSRIREDTSGATNYFMGIKSASGGTALKTTAVDAGNTTVLTNPNSTTAFGIPAVYYTDPTTANAWTPTGTNSLDNMQIGVGTTDGNPDTWALGEYAMVEYSSAAPDISSGPFIHWKMDEGSGAAIADSGANAFNGVLGDGSCAAGVGVCPTWASGRNGGALNFDASNDYASRGDIDALDGLQRITVSLWIKSDTITSASAETHLLDKSACLGTADSGVFEFLGGGFSANKATFLIVPSGGTPSAYLNATGTTTIDDTKWHHLAGVYDGLKLYIYVDGKVDGSTSSANVTMASVPAGAAASSAA